MASKSVVRDGGDWTALIKAIHEPGLSERNWARDIVDAARPLLADVAGMGLVVVQHSADCHSTSAVTTGFSPEQAALVAVGTDELAPMKIAGLRRYFYPAYPVSSHLEVERGLDDEPTRIVREYRRSLGVADALGIIVHPEPGTVAVLCGMFDRAVALTRVQRMRLTRVALHLETSFRLRRRPEIVRAVLDAHGRVLHRTAEAPADHVLSSHAARMTRSLGRGRRDAAEPLDLWPALLSGRFSLVERGTGAGRRYFVVENASTTQPIRALTSLEVDVVSQAARGLPNKLIGYALGLSPATVSNRLSSASSKIGAASCLELVRLAAMLSRDPRASFSKLALTVAERDVLELLQQGLSNGDIAKMRSRSARTIANQVAALLRKTQSPSRRALMAMPPAEMRGDA